MENRINTYKDKIKIRLEAPEDYDGILQLTYESFLALDFEGRRRMDEHYLIHLIKNSDSLIPELCFVAELEGTIIGHILYTKSQFKREDGSHAETITFGPLSVLPEYQKQGIGKALIFHSIEHAKKLGFGAIIITGVPEYYPKLGFKVSKAYNLTLEDGTSPDYLLAYELSDGYLKGGGVFDVLAPEFQVSEEDDRGFELFHTHFMSTVFPGELMLRAFCENDIPLMEKWLYTQHVKPWYEHPNDWLTEIRERYGAFSFITHLIAEVDGKAMGFCQYYDCYNSKDYEDWGLEIPLLGKVYSIDYLIGDPDYLHKGYAKTMINKMIQQLRGLGATTLIVLPDEKNIASNKLLEASGFAWDGKRYMLEL